MSIDIAKVFEILVSNDYRPERTSKFKASVNNKETLYEVFFYLKKHGYLKKYCKV
jgi:hypothetical protein